MRTKTKLETCSKSYSNYLCYSCWPPQRLLAWLALSFNHLKWINYEKASENLTYTIMCVVNNIVCDDVCVQRYYRWTSRYSDINGICIYVWHRVSSHNVNACSTWLTQSWLWQSNLCHSQHHDSLVKTTTKQAVDNNKKTSLDINKKTKFGNGLLKLL